MRNLKNVVNNIAECIPEDFNPMLKKELLAAKTDLWNVAPECQVDYFNNIENILYKFLGDPQFIKSNEWVKKVVKIWNSPSESNKGS